MLLPRRGSTEMVASILSPCYGLTCPPAKRWAALGRPCGQELGLGSQGRGDGLSPPVQGMSPDHNAVWEFGSESFLGLRPRHWSKSCEGSWGRDAHLTCAQISDPQRWRKQMTVVESHSILGVLCYADTDNLSIIYYRLWFIIFHL